MITEKLIFKIPYEIAPASFHPSDLTGGQLYLRKDQATVSSWVSDIGTARDFAQATSTQQPTISTNSVDFDGVNDYQSVTESNSFGSDSSGIIFFSGYFTGGNDFILTSADLGSNLYGFNVVLFGGKIRVQAINNTVIDQIEGSTVITSGAYYYGYIKGNGFGNPYTISVNGSIDTNTVLAGTDQSVWYGGIGFRDNLALGVRLRASAIYSTAKINKIYYNNTALTSGEIADMNTFMSNPTNF